jgi:RNA polymerase sigma-70 factor (ECF subfamily)
MAAASPVFVQSVATGRVAAVNAAESARPTFAEALRANQAMVFSIAYHFLRNRATAEEVAQDVFLQLYRNLDRLESDAHVTFWLRRATSNRCIDCVRKQKSHPSVALEDVREPSVAAHSGDPLLDRRLQALIASLPEKPRLVMILRFQEEMMPEEIARTLDMPVRTVKSHLQRSLAMLREKMERSMGPRNLGPGSVGEAR